LFNYSFSQLIELVDQVQSAPISDEIKLRRSGELFYLGSEQILLQAQTLLEESQQSNVNKGDTKIDQCFSSWLASFTQQSISTNFLNKFLLPTSRAEYQREAVITCKSLSATEALEELAEDLIESEMFSLAHDENIEVWIDLVDRHLHLCPEANTLSAIALLNNITLAQVFMAILFGSFQIEQSGGFYEEFKIKLCTSC
jgi:hypothetical protein